MFYNWIVCCPCFYRFQPRVTFIRPGFISNNFYIIFLTFLFTLLIIYSFLFLFWWYFQCQTLYFEKYICLCFLGVVFVLWTPFCSFVANYSIILLLFFLISQAYVYVFVFVFYCLVLFLFLMIPWKTIPLFI